MAEGLCGVADQCGRQVVCEVADQRLAERLCEVADQGGRVVV